MPPVFLQSTTPQATTEFYLPARISPLERVLNGLTEY
ncbi:hypothetical protein BLAT2472_50045 [Burkholderia latens]